jgi:RimJ/RimL family protein N-acetyltransferase
MITLTRELSSKQRAWRNDVRISAWSRQNGLISLEEMYKWHERTSRDPTKKIFGLLNEHNENVGTVGLSNISLMHGTAEFSILIGPEYQLKGYGKEGLIELLKYGFNHLRLNTIYGETFYGNPALKLFLSLGFTDEGKLRSRYFKFGQYVDVHAISMLSSDAQRQEWW